MTAGAYDAAGTRGERRRWRGVPGARRAAEGDPPLFEHLPDDAAVGDLLLAPLWTAPPGWWPLLGACVLLSLLFAATVGYSIAVGPGVWGNNIPAAWAYPIVNFVWWIGVGHAGAFLSAALLLGGHRWRGGVHRLAELMAMVALLVSGIFPILHLGRQWMFFWLLPYPSTTGLWPQFKSSLAWDVVTIMVHLAVTALLLFVGLLPDLALARDRAPAGWRRRAYAVLALGWRGSAWQWRQRRQAYVVLAALTATLVVSSESAVSFDFAIAQQPGWHSTLFPVYFVIAALYSGVAFLLLLLLPLRRVLRLQPVVTRRHLDRAGLLLLAFGSLFGWVLAVETFTAWYSGGELGRTTLVQSSEPSSYGWLLWGIAVLAVLAPQLLWWRRLRRSAAVLAAVSAIVLVALWIERFTLVIASLNRGFVPSSWATYLPTWVDWSILLGSFGVFGLLLLLLVRLVPVVAVDEIRRLRREPDEGVATVEA